MKRAQVKRGHPDLDVAVRGGDWTRAMDREGVPGGAKMEQALYWRQIYAEILDMEEKVLKRMHELMTTQSVEARREVELTDVPVVVAQAERFRKRLMDLWYSRLYELQGFWLDPEGRRVWHQGREVALTKREFQLLQLLLDHPYCYFTTSQILRQAWADPALFPEEVRNYVQRVRKILADLTIPVDLVHKRGCGYTLVFPTQLTGDSGPRIERPLLKGLEVK